MFLRGDYWHYDFTSGGVRYRGSTGYKKSEKKEAIAAVERVRVQAREKHSIGMIWEQTKRSMLDGKEIPLDYTLLWEAFCRTGYSNAGSERMKLYSRHLKMFCQWMGELHPEIQKISGVLPAHAQEWMLFLYNSDGAKSTCNDYLATLRMIFRTLGHDYGIIENPFDSVRKKKDDKIPREAFTPEELTLIGQKATGWIYSLCLTAISTGLREEDICLMQKSSVNLNSGWIHISRTKKTGSEVDIPILPGLLRHLQIKMNADTVSDFVFPDLADRYRTNPSSIGKKVKSFFEEIGISGATKKVDGYKRKLSQKDIHSFRHTFVYLAAIHGVPFPIVQGIVGHTTPNMTKHYMNHADREAKAQYLNQLPDYLAGNMQEVVLNRKKEITPDRIARILRKLTPENLARNKSRLLTLL